MRQEADVTATQSGNVKIHPAFFCETALRCFAVFQWCSCLDNASKHTVRSEYKDSIPIFFVHVLWAWPGKARVALYGVRDQLCSYHASAPALLLSRQMLSSAAWYKTALEVYQMAYYTEFQSIFYRLYCGTCIYKYGIPSRFSIRHALGDLRSTFRTRLHANRWTFATLSVLLKPHNSAP